MCASVCICVHAYVWELMFVCACVCGRVCERERRNVKGIHIYNISYLFLQQNSFGERLALSEATLRTARCSD